MSFDRERNSLLRRFRRSPPLLAGILTLIGLLLTALSVERTLTAERALEAASVQGQMHGVLNRYAEILFDAQAALRLTAAVSGMMGVPTAEQWEVINRGIDAENRLPGLAAFGYARLQLSGEVVEALRIERVDTHDARWTRFSGSPIPHDAAVAAAVQAAVRLHRTRMTPPLGWCGDTPCVLLMAPIYLGGTVPETEAARFELATGMVFAVLMPREIARGVMAAAAAPRALKVFDMTTAAPQEVAMLGRFEDMPHQVERSVEIGGRHWMLSMAQENDGDEVTAPSRVPWVAATGLTLTLLVVMLSLQQTLMWRRAERTAEDMTRAVRQSEQRFRQLSEMSAEWFWEQGPDLRFTLMSEGMAATGFDPKSFIGRTRIELAKGWSAEQIAEHQRLQESQQSFRRFEYDLVDPDGNPRRFMISGDPFFDEYGVFAGYRGVGRDVTESRRLQRELQESHANLAKTVEERTRDLRSAKEAAEEANRAKSEFLANMSHELRTPLHAMLSFSKIGLNKALTAPPERLQGYFEKIHTAGERLLHLVNDLLDLAKLEAGRMVITAAPRDLNALVHEVCDELQPLLVPNELRFDLPPREMVVEAEIDAVRIVQVVRNLLSNAIKFSRPGRAISVSLVPHPVGQGVDGWCMTVSDEGIGIPEAELASVFDKFVQSSKTKTGAGGTGLGLSITREIVEAHGGRIRAYNRSGGGAAFEVVLPRHHAPHRTPT